jgi:hypothetical protein
MSQNRLIRPGARFTEKKDAACLIKSEHPFKKDHQRGSGDNILGWGGKFALG